MTMASISVAFCSPIPSLVPFRVAAIFFKTRTMTMNAFTSYDFTGIYFDCFWKLLEVKRSIEYQT